MLRPDPRTLLQPHPRALQPQLLQRGQIVSSFPACDEGKRGEEGKSGGGRGRGGELDVHAVYNGRSGNPLGLCCDMEVVTAAAVSKSPLTPPRPSQTSGGFFFDERWNKRRFQMANKRLGRAESIMVMDIVAEKTNEHGCTPF